MKIINHKGHERTQRRISIKKFFVSFVVESFSVVLRVSAAAFLVLFPRAARTRIVASDLGRAADHLLHRLQVTGAGHASLLQLAALLALEGFFDFVNGGG